MFALVLERDPLLLSRFHFLSSLNSWVQVVGGMATFGLLLWLISFAAARRSTEGANWLFKAGFIIFLAVLLGPLVALLVLLFFFWKKSPDLPGMRVETGQRAGILMTVLFVSGVVWAFLGYLLAGVLNLPELITWASSDEDLVAAMGWRGTAQSILLTVAGAAAIFAVLLPLLASLPQHRLRRIMALARLTFKEAIRRKILLIPLASVFVFLFGDWFITTTRPEDQFRNYVSVVSFSMQLLLIVAALLLASFTIPDDIRHQTIHTVLTKPVQRFEIFLGRFLGLTALLTLMLLGLGLLSQAFVVREVLRGPDPDAAAESLKARVPIYGDLHFEGTRDPKEATNVGREWDYRSYIAGPMVGQLGSQPTQYAVWSFRDLPTNLLKRDKVRCEFSLDIYRTTKGIEGQGVFCTFQVESWQFDSTNPAQKERYDQARLLGQANPNIDRQLAEEFGFFEVPTKEIKDYHTQWIEIPVEVFKNALQRMPEPVREGKGKPGIASWFGSTGPEQGRPQLRIRVKCESRTQFVGMAKYDMYLRADDPEGGYDALRFCINFFKGVGFGLWLQLCLVTGLAVALSTYLSSIITLLTTSLLYVLGFFQDFIQEVAFRNNITGPLEGALRLVDRPGGSPGALELPQTTVVQVSTALDMVFGWLLRLVLEIIPDVDRFSFTDFVAEGVAVSSGQMLMSLLLLVGYLLPWAVFAFYLLKWREVASST